MAIATEFVPKETILGILRCSISSSRSSVLILSRSSRPVQLWRLLAPPLEIANLPCDRHCHNIQPSSSSLMQLTRPTHPSPSIKVLRFTIHTLYTSHDDIGRVVDQFQKYKENSSLPILHHTSFFGHNLTCSIPPGRAGSQPGCYKWDCGSRPEPMLHERNRTLLQSTSFLKNQSFFYLYFHLVRSLPLNLNRALHLGKSF